MDKNILQNSNMQNILAYARENHIPVLLDDTAKLLFSKINNQKPKNVLEIGTAIGYSGTLILNASNCKLTTIEKDEASFNLAKHHFEKFGLTNRVNQILGDALEELNNLVKLNKKFDFIFLDGPKGQYIKYLPILKQLINNSGVLFADNVFFKRMIFIEGTIPHRKRTIVVNLRKFLETVKTDNNFYNVEILDVGDGVLIANYKENLW